MSLEGSFLSEVHTVSFFQGAQSRKSGRLGSEPAELTSTLRSPQQSRGCSPPESLNQAGIPFGECCTSWEPGGRVTMGLRKDSVSTESVCKPEDLSSNPWNPQKSGLAARACNLSTGEQRGNERSRKCTSQPV